MKIATATLDLAFLMLSSTKSDMRSESTGEILSTYHDVFSQYLTVLNPHLEKPTIEELEADYYKSLEYAILQVFMKILRHKILIPPLKFLSHNQSLNFSSFYKGHLYVCAANALLQHCY